MKKRAEETLKKGFTVEFVTEMTRLSMEEVQKITDSLNQQEIAYFRRGCQLLAKRRSMATMPTLQHKLKIN